ncbi:MAG TPA: hypothetical protein PKK61_12980, partial [Defluviitaleaceae bacterium]|nr:hypothetical protein [Defluviitaleaceae bacterium]
IYKKHYYYGKSINQYIKTNKKYAAKQLSPIRPAFIKNAGKFLKKPLMTFLFLIYNFVKYFAAFNGMVVSIFTKKEEGII